MSFHAERERQKDKITMNELNQAFSNLELIEDYPEDPRGHSALFLGFASGKPIHMVIGDFDAQLMTIITVYRPDPKKWIEYKRRRK